MLGHTKIESTVRYLGIEVDDAIEIAERSTSDPDVIGRIADVVGDETVVADHDRFMSASGMLFPPFGANKRT